MVSVRRFNVARRPISPPQAAGATLPSSTSTKCVCDGLSGAPVAVAGSARAIVADTLRAPSKTRRPLTQPRGVTAMRTIRHTPGRRSPQLHHAGKRAAGEDPRVRRRGSRCKALIKRALQKRRAKSPAPRLLPK